MQKSQKKPCHKLTVKLSDASEAPIVVTTSQVQRNKAMKSKTSFAVYQNTSDKTNPRLSSQTMLVMNCDGVQSVGKSWQMKNYGTQYMVGVVDKDTNEMTLVPASLINVSPYIKSYDEASAQEELTFGEKHKEVMMKFGDNRIRRSITGKDRIRTMESNTLEEAMVEAVSTVDVTHLTSETDLQHADGLPPINMLAKSLDDVFTITDLISEAELTALLPFTRVLQECTTTHVTTWRQQNKFPEFMLHRLPVVMVDEDLAHLYLSQLLYISYLITLLKLPQKQLRNKTTNFPNTPTVVISSIYKRFTSQGHVEGKFRMSMSDKQKNKLISYILVLSLIVDKYSVHFKDLCKDTGISQRIITDTYRSMGCTVNKLKQAGQGSTVAANLRLPIKLPSVVLRKGGKRRN